MKKFKNNNSKKILRQLFEKFCSEVKYGDKAKAKRDLKLDLNMVCGKRKTNDVEVTDNHWTEI